MFDDNPQKNFALINFNEYDKAIKSYNIKISFVFIESDKITFMSFINVYIVS